MPGNPMPAALDRLRTVNGYFVVGHGPGDAVAGRPAADLFDAAVAEELFDAGEQILRTGERRVAVSWVFFDYISRIWAVALGTAVRTGRSVSLDPWQLRVGRDGNNAALHLPRPVPGGSPVDEALVRHTAPLIERWSEHVAPQVLWGNAASSVRGAAAALGPESDAVVARTMTHPALSAAVEPDGRRRSCCLLYRGPIGAYCGDCALVR